MTAAPTIKGWCPTLLSPMQSGDGWLARVKPTAATVSAAHARIVAEAARRRGNGHIDLTSRANFQIRGLTPRSAELFTEIIIEEGLASARPSFEAIRNVMASPLGPDDRSAAFDSQAVARDLETMLGEEQALAALPAKFGLLADGGGVLPLAGVTADIMVRADRGEFLVELDGGRLAARCAPPALAETVKALALAFLHVSWERRGPPRRMRTLIMTVGEEAIFGAAGLTPIVMPSTSPSGAPSPIGFISYPSRAEGSLGVGLPFGRIEAEALSSLADLSERYGDGSLRTTPWRALLVPGIASANAEQITGDIRGLGLIADSADPRLHIFACVGAPSCQSASVDARADASHLAATIPATRDHTIHVSGCIKACAHRGPAALTLVGRDGRYDLVRNGSAADQPALTGLNIEQAVALLQSAKEQQRA
jgi:precorrin-3B synthase